MANSKNSQVYKTVPKSWEVKQVKELSTLEKNAVLTGPFGSLLHSADYVESGIPLILIKNIKNGKIDVKDIPHVTEKDAHRLSRYRVKEGDVVFSRVGRVGSSALIEKEHEGWLISGQTLRIRFDNPKINPKYINYFFQSDVFSDILSKEILGMTRDSINTTILAEILVLIPTLSEQKKIISIISNMDYLIKKLELVIKSNKHLKLGLMQQLLTKGIKHKKFKKVKWLFRKEIEIPEEWKIKKIGECCNILDSKRIPINSEERKKIQGTIPYYGANGIQGYVNDHIFDEELILLAEDGGYFEEYKTRPIAQYVVGKCWVNNHAHVLNAKNNNFLKLVFYSLIHKNITPYINGSTRTKLNQSDLRQISILIPSINEQQKIASILSGVDAYIQKTQEYKEKLDILKRGLMQKLLTGQIRV